MHFLVFGCSAGIGIAAAVAIIKIDNNPGILRLGLKERGKFPEKNGYSFFFVSVGTSAP